MIQPNMATMLAFLATDAAISPPLLSQALRDAVAGTFNAITVDGDTSTNDTVANSCERPEWRAKDCKRETLTTRTFSAALGKVCRTLALKIVEDGEGAQRVIEIEVRGAPSDRAATQIARTIANFATRKNGSRRRRSQLGAHPRRRGASRCTVRLRARGHQARGNSRLPPRGRAPIF